MPARYAEPAFHSRIEHLLVHVSKNSLAIR